MKLTQLIAVSFSINFAIVCSAAEPITIIPSVVRPAGSIQLGDASVTNFSPLLGSKTSIEIKNADFTSVTRQLNHTKTMVFDSAVVHAGGIFIRLDVSENPLAKQQLVKHSVLRHGDLREPKLSVSGTLEYRMRNDVGLNLDGSSFYLVIVVKSLSVSLQ